MVRSRERGGVGVMMSSELNTRTAKWSHLARIHVHLHNLSKSRSLMYSLALDQSTTFCILSISFRPFMRRLHNSDFEV